MTDELRIEYLPLSELKRHPRNPKDHDIGAISRSVNRFGFTAPVILDERTGYLAAGHGRIDTLAQLKAQGKQPPANVKTDKAGEWLVPVVRGHGFNSDEEVKAYLVADNRITSLGGWNEPELVALLQDLAAQDEALLEVTGYDGDDLQALIDELGGAFDEPAEDKGAQIDRAAELQAEWQTERGQLWIIPSKTAKGEHRLLIDDCTNGEAIGRVLASEQIDLVFTDPPYGVAYSGRGQSTQQQTIENDDLDLDGLNTFLRSAFTAWNQYMRPGCVVYVCHADRPRGTRPVFETAFTGAGWKFSATIIWVKQAAGMGWQDYRAQHEPLLYGWKQGEHYFCGDRTLTTVWHIDRDAGGDYAHPTQKPVELPLAAINNSSRRNSVVFDGFCGSGGTIAACELAGRKCRAIELDSAYAAVILQRMADMGLEPRLAD